MNHSETKYIIIMVGLPARGKSFLSQKLNSLFNFLDIRSEIFNLGSYRRKNSNSNFDSHYFAPDNVQAKSEREKFARLALEDAFEFLKAPSNHAAIYDGTNLLLERREYLRSVLIDKNVKVIWIQLECDNQSLVSLNVTKSKLDLKDYEMVKDKSTAYSDFMKRIEEYQKSAVKISNKEITDHPRESFILIREMGSEIEFHIPEDTSLEYLKLENYLTRVYSRKVKVDVALLPNFINNDDSIKVADTDKTQSENSSQKNFSRIELTSEDFENETKRLHLFERLVGGSSQNIDITCYSESPYAYQLMSLFKF